MNNNNTSSNNPIQYLINMPKKIFSYLLLTVMLGICVSLIYNIFFVEGIPNTARHIMAGHLIIFATASWGLFNFAIRKEKPHNNNKRAKHPNRKYFT
jgi:hypothetical protein